MKIGARIKALRQKQGLTIEELAVRCELTKGFISQLERDLTSPSIENLNNILEVLGTNISDFFKKQKLSKYVYTPAMRYEENKPEYNIEWLIPNAQSNEMEPIRLIIKSQQQSPMVKPFDGEIFGYVLIGSITIVSGETKYIANTNDSFYLYGDQEHYVINHTNYDAELIWVSTPPIF